MTIRRSKSAGRSFIRASDGCGDRPLSRLAWLSGLSPVYPPRRRREYAENPDAREGEPPRDAALVAAGEIEHHAEHQRREKRCGESRKRINGHRRATAFGRGGSDYARGCA